MFLEILLGCFIVFGLLTVWVGYHFSSQVIKLPRAAQETTPDQLGLPYERLSLPTQDGLKLAGWFVPRDGSQKTIVVCHGWGAERSNVLPSTAFLHRGGYNLLYFDFRNHGESEGTVSSVGPLELRDLDAALDHLLKSKPDKARWIGIYGLSMGASVALTATASRPEIRAVVAESPFHSFNEIVVRFGKLFYNLPRYPVGPITLSFVRRRLGLDPEEASPGRHIRRISPRPLLIIQGERDLRMPPVEGETLFRLAGEPKELWIVRGADHGEAYSINPRAYEEKVLGFFNKASSDGVKS